MKTWNSGKKVVKQNNNRINLLMAIVFVLGALILVKLFYLQVFRYNYYTDSASLQHLSSRAIEAKRGRIFINDNTEQSTEKLFPLATNKDFAVIYAKPNEIRNPEILSRQFYYAFEKDKIKNEVDSIINLKIKELTKPLPGATSTEPRKLEDDEQKKFNEEKIALLKEKRDQSIKKYFEKINNPDDIYAPIASKVEDKNLKKLYAILLSDQAQYLPDEKGEDKIANFKINDINIKDGKIYNLASSSEDELKIDGVGFVWKIYRYYPENNIGAHILGYVTDTDEVAKGNYGLEGFFNDELSGLAGSVKAERGAGGSLIIINDREYNKPKDGSDLILTIDRSIQFFACEKLNIAVQKHGADSGSVIVINPKTGEILAMCGYPDFDPNNYSEVKNLKYLNNPAIFSNYEPGSIFKVITMSMGLDQEKVTPETTYNDTGVVQVGAYKMLNSDKKANGIQTMTQVLEKSLNTGAIFVTQKVGFPVFKNYMDAYGFGEVTGIELGGEAKGNINQLNIKKNQALYYYNASFGQGISVTAIQMIAAFGAIANQGILMKPYLVKEIIQENGEKNITEPRAIRRVISERAASLLGGMMVNVVENGHGKKAAVAGYYVGGKTGTAQVPRKDGRGYESGAHIGSFAGFAPVDNPVFAMIVRMDNPRDVEWAESSAAPLFGEIAQFILSYEKVPTSRKIEEKKK